MKSESLMRNLAQLNIRWDGTQLRIDRRTSDSFTVQGARLTVGLAAQPDTVRTFMEATKGLARGSGFAARFLIAWPETTQGGRAYREAPENWPRLGAFHRRIEELLKEQEGLTLTNTGGIEPAVLDFDRKAKAAWIGLHDEIERELAPGGEMERTRDVASKAADNVARLAALFHVFEHGPGGTVSEGHIRAAGAIVTWHLYEARRFLGELALPAVMVNAAALEKWAQDKCRVEGMDAVRRQEVQHHGPGALRHGKALDEAINELEALGRARLVTEGRQKLIRLHPAILAGGKHGA
jgi:putative DNA primase/helicase